MPSNNYNSLLEETKKSLSRIQSFDVETLVQEKELGAKQNFRDALVYASKSVNFARLVSVEALSDVSEPQLEALRNQFNAVFNTFDQILKYHPEQHAGHRQNYINQCEAVYNELFNRCNYFLSYSVGRTADFKRLENEGRSAVQLIKDQTSELINSLKERESEGQRILEDIRKVAAEQGVSQQAIYFKNESEAHHSEATIWLKRMVISAVFLGFYSFSTIFLHKIPFIAPTSAYETVQLAISKMLVFGVLSFLVYICAKNFLANKHNSIINKHRQNGLMTFKALVDAAGDPQSKEVILNHAAAAIFTPQPTGYSLVTNSEGSTAKSVVELVGSTISGKE